MSNKDDEVRRLQRLREEQLRARDPSAKEKALHQRLSTKHRKARKRITVKSVILDFPAKWLLMIIGGLLGVLIALIINMVVQEQWVKVVGLIIVVFGIAVGRLLGAVRDWGDEDWGRKY
jgi:VIT1/CCC1 family predicted Fe2+/Mn2+ transporter